MAYFSGLHMSMAGNPSPDTHMHIIYTYHTHKEKEGERRQRNRNRQRYRETKTADSGPMFRVPPQTTLIQSLPHSWVRIKIISVSQMGHRSHRKVEYLTQGP